MNKQLTMFEKPPCKFDKPLRLIELFAGYGSQAMALKRIGADFERYRAIEVDKYAMSLYNAVHGTDFVVTDIRDVKGEDLGIVDKDKHTYMLTYSFPCVDLSLAGKMQGMSKCSGTRSGLLWEVERLLTETEELPDILMMENVPQVISKKNKADFDAWVQFLDGLGYHSYGQILNACDYGVPQSRKRYFMFSFLDDVSYEFPEPIELKKCLGDLLENDVEEKHYITSEKAQLLAKELACSVTNGMLKNHNDHNKIIIAGKMNHKLDNTYESANRVYSPKGIAPTLPTGVGGGHIPKIIVRGNYEDKKVNTT